MRVVQRRRYTYTVEPTTDDTEMPAGFNVYLSGIEQPVGWAPTVEDALDLISDFEDRLGQ